MIGDQKSPKWRRKASKRHTHILDISVMCRERVQQRSLTGLRIYLPHLDTMVDGTREDLASIEISVYDRHAVVVTRFKGLAPCHLRSGSEAGGVELGRGEGAAEGLGRGGNCG